MANQLYGKFKELLLKGTLGDLSSAGVKIGAALIDTTKYGPSGTVVPNYSTDQFMSTISATSGAVVSRLLTADQLASKTIVGGLFNAANTAFRSVTGNPCGAIVLYIDNGSDAADNLIAWYDTGTGLPVTPTGTDIPINWSTLASKIFQL